MAPPALAVSTALQGLGITPNFSWCRGVSRRYGLLLQIIFVVCGNRHDSSCAGRFDRRAAILQRVSCGFNCRLTDFAASCRAEIGDDVRAIHIHTPTQGLEPL